VDGKKEKKVNVHSWQGKKNYTILGWLGMEKMTSREVSRQPESDLGRKGGPDGT